jgi:NAD(P)H-dependent flavin oxidoreductase YrpB (nitropropane dioxygenase family)
MLHTALCDVLGIRHPILQAGMNVAAGPELAAAVTNAGGLGVIGGLGYTPKFLRQQIAALKDALMDKNAPFGVDLLLPKVGEGARKTNYDYTQGHLAELVDAIIDGGAKLFVCAVGVPPKWVVEKMHAANILVMNMTGLPKHAIAAMDVGCDIICAQGTEGKETRVTLVVGVLTLLFLLRSGRPHGRFGHFGPHSGHSGRVRGSQVAPHGPAGAGGGGGRHL